MSKKPTVAFERVSSKDQRDGFSLDAQQKLSEKYSKENNLIVVKRWSVDESASKEESRKHFFAMIDYVKDNDIKNVIFDKVDRACRGLKSAQMIEDLLEKRGVKFHFTRDGLTIDADSPASEKLRFYLHVILAKYYIDNLKCEIKKGLDERSAAGFWNHKAPLGYKNIRISPDGRQTSDNSGRAIIEIDPLISPIVIEAFELYSTGNYCQRDLLEFFNSKMQGRKIDKSCVDTLISNPFYYGAMKAKGGKVLPGKHTPLISKELWDACQKIKSLRAKDHRVNNSKFIPKPFMGLIKCGACSHSITGQVKRKPTGKIYIYYHCANLNCPERANYVSQEKIEAQLSDAFIPFSKFTPDATRAFIEAVKGSLDDVEIFNQRTMTEFADKQTAAKRSIANLERLHHQ